MRSIHMRSIHMERGLHGQSGSSNCEDHIGTACESLDFVEASHRHRVYPFMYCHIELEGHLDLVRLKRAIQLTSHSVPEIFYICDFKQGRFKDAGFTADDVILFEDNILFWDLSKKPQLQINICRQEQGDLVIIGMSHILTDGAGVLQYLYLLSGLYNGKSPDRTLRNHREPGPFLKNIHIRRQSEQTRRGKRKRVSPLRASCQDTHSFCLISRISEEDFLLLHEKAQKSHVTLNDVFMTAYARVISKMKNMDTVVIPCPADLRRFRPEADELTVANLTGIYRRVTVEINPQDSFHATLWQVHIEMKLQRARQRCFAGVPLLNWAYHRIPRPLLGQVIKANYPLLPVSYTNMGQIDHGKLSFSHCRIMSCYLTGTYRKSPDFQLSISTFQNVCTLNCTLMGEEGDDLKGQYILDQVKKEILEWVPVVK